MKSIVKNLATFGLVGTLSCFPLAGCGASSDETNINKEEKVSIETEDIDESKYFDAGEHLFFERYYLNAQEITGGSISIPERYSVYDIENFSSIYGKGYLYGGYDVWFQNDVPVEAAKVYNKVFEIYDYSKPGTPILENIEEPIQKVK